MTDRPLYLCYAKSKQEIYVRDELRLIGADVWCGLVLEGKPDPKRAGRKRATIWTERPVLPNYLWARMSPQQFYDSRTIKHLSPTMTLVPWSAERDLRRFQDMTDRAYEQARRARDRGEQAPPAFEAGQVLEIIGGPLQGLTARFRGIVEDAEGFHVEADGPLGVVKANPAHVKKAG
jgi:transcription antitermination factor NusG